MNLPTARGWRPGASLAILEARARMLARSRAFFAERRIMEADVPALVAATVTDPRIASIGVRLDALPARDLFLHTSPEYLLKRLLAAGGPDTYFLGKVYRDGELGRHHQPEFTLAEWYRRDFDLAAMAAECCELIRVIAGVAGAAPRAGASRSYRDAFHDFVGLDPLAADVAALRDCAERYLGAGCPSLGDERTAWLDLLMSHCIAPALPPDELTVIRHFPAAQAALARLVPGDPAVAERFEVFWRGVELANGYRELTDAAEQAGRFAADREARQLAGLPDVQADQELLAALSAGLPDCAGVAVGFDRVAMLALDLPDIRQAISFPL